MTHMYEVTANRQIRNHDYEIEAFIEANNHNQAAQKFVLDMLLVGWEVERLNVVLLGTTDKTIVTYRIEKNLIRKED